METLLFDSKNQTFKNDVVGNLFNLPQKTLNDTFLELLNANINI